jgi:hypothetical protein
LQAFPNMNTTTRSWDEMTTRTLVVAMPINNRVIMVIIIITKTLMRLWSWLTAVFVSFRECASDLRSRYALTWSKKELSKETDSNQIYETDSNQIYMHQNI